MKKLITILVIIIGSWTPAHDAYLLFFFIPQSIVLSAQYENGTMVKCERYTGETLPCTFGDKAFLESIHKLKGNNNFYE